MKNLILQHFTGELRELEILSKANIEAYAKSVGAEYKLIQGYAFHPDLTHPCQKLAMFDEQFDEYDTVVMVDIDMFTRIGNHENIFETTGIGCSTEFQRRLKWKNLRKFNGLANPFNTYWGGAIWRLEKEQRIALRQNLHRVDVMKYNGKLEDEGIMHILAPMAGINGPTSILPGGEKWACGSYHDDIDNAVMVHIRPRRSRKGPRVPKIEIYHELVEQGIILN